MIWKTRRQPEWTAAAKRTEADAGRAAKYSGGAFKGYTHKNASGDFQQRDGRNG